jgi:hypothetical protein
VSKGSNTLNEVGSGSPKGLRYHVPFPHLRRRAATAVIEANLPRLDRLYEFHELVTEDALYFQFEKALKVSS